MNPNPLDILCTEEYQSVIQHQIEVEGGMCLKSMQELRYVDVKKYIHWSLTNNIHLDKVWLAEYNFLRVSLKQFGKLN